MGTAVRIGVHWCSPEGPVEVQDESWCFFLLLLAKQNQVAASLQPFMSALVLWTDESSLLSSKSLSPNSVLPIGLQRSFLLR